MAALYHVAIHFSLFALGATTPYTWFYFVSHFTLCRQTFFRYIPNFPLLFSVFRSKENYFPNFFVSLQLVRGEIRTNEEAFAIISR